MSPPDSPRPVTEADLAPQALFELGDWEHARLFDGCRHAWQALGRRLAEYLGDTVVGRLDGTVSPEAHVVGDRVQVEEGAVIEPGAYVAGPCIIGRGAEVRHGAYIRGNALVGAGAVVGHATEVKGSIFLPGAKAGHFAYVGDSILGRDVNLGAGTKLANLRLARDEVVVRLGAGLVPTGHRKLGAILGDGAQTGCNAVTNPGTVLGRGALVHPCLAVGGAHRAGTVLRGARATAE